MKKNKTIDKTNFRKHQRIALQTKLLQNKADYDVKACVIAGCLPIFLEFFEDLNEVFPSHYTKEWISATSKHLNSIYYKCPEEERSTVADQQIAISEGFRKWISENFKPE